MFDNFTFHPEDYVLHDRYMCVTLVLKKLELA